QVGHNQKRSPRPARSTPFERPAARRERRSIPNYRVLFLALGREPNERHTIYLPRTDLGHRSGTIGASRRYFALSLLLLLMSTEQRLQAEWKPSENNRRAKYYALTPLGKQELENEAANWRRLSAAISLVVELEGA